MPKNKPIYAFIDSQNLNLGVLSQGWKLDFKKFRIYLKDKYKVDKAYLFIGQVPGNEKLYSFLRNSGYKLILKPTVDYKSKEGAKTKGNVDAELVLHTMIQWGNFTKAVIVSGDGDFYCLIDHLESHNKLFKVITPSKKYSSLLRKYARYIVLVSLFKDKVSFGKK